jgi:hypothetical protein
MLLFIAASFSEQTVADISIDIQKHVDNDEDERADREDNKPNLAEVSNRMERFVGNRGNELFRGARMALRACFDLILTDYG